MMMATGMSPGVSGNFCLPILMCVHRISHRFFLHASNSYVSTAYVLPLIYVGICTFYTYSSQLLFVPIPFTVPKSMEWIGAQPAP